MRFRVYPYKQGSVSAKTLANSLGGKVLKLVDSKYKPKEGDVIINWGSGKLANFGPARVLNQDTSLASCKLQSFKGFKQHGVNHPDFWENKQDIPDDAFPVCCRTVLRGHSANGLVIANKREDLVDAKLYTVCEKER
jgi:hypothetical protein